MVLRNGEVKIPEFSVSSNMIIHSVIKKPSMHMHLLVQLIPEDV